MMWAEYRGQRADNIAAAWLAMHDESTALASVFKDVEGRFLVVYQVGGNLAPTCDKFFRTLKTAQAHAEKVIEQNKLLVPRKVLLDHHTGEAQWQTLLRQRRPN